MSTRHLLAAGTIAAFIVACGGNVSTGTGQNGLSGGSSDDRGITYVGDCTAADCADYHFACASGPATNLRCVRGEPGGSAGPKGLCKIVGDCPPEKDPCAGQTLPACPRECDSFPMQGACASGDACRMQGSTIGDECACTDGQWACAVHPPLGMGCNRVCEPAPSADPCDGVKLPACPAECSAFPMSGACAAGDRCRAKGSKIGDECACGQDGTWGCAVHPPLGMGCNLVCR